MLELSMHILDIAQNSLAAGATRIEIRVLEDWAGDVLRMEIRDNGRGISPEAVARVTDPFFTSRTTREVGLGLPLLKEAAERCEGGLEIHSEEGRGTAVCARFRLDHFDRAPLGDMAQTMEVLIGANPQIEFFYEHRVNGETYSLETREMKEVLGPVGLDDPAVLDFIRQDIRLGLKKIGAAAFPKTMEVLR